MNIELSDADKKVISNSASLYPIMQKIFLREQEIDRNREHFWVVGLDTKLRILFIELVSLGTVNQSLVKPMEVFSFALQKRAVRIIAVHNHPSGDLTPSKADKDITDRLIQTGRIVDCPLEDHLIMSETKYVSFAEMGLMAWLGNSNNSHWYLPDEPWVHAKNTLLFYKERLKETEKLITVWKKEYAKREKEIAKMAKETGVKMKMDDVLKEPPSTSTRTELILKRNQLISKLRTHPVPMPDDEIARLTGLSVAEVMKL